LTQRILERGEIEALDHTAIPRLRLPDAAQVFHARAARLKKLASGQVPGIPIGKDNAALRGYLLLMAELVQVQQSLVLSPSFSSDFLQPDWPEPAQLAQALQHGLPPLPVNRLPAHWENVCRQFMLRLQQGTRHEQLQTPLNQILQANGEELKAMAHGVLAQDESNLDPSLAPLLACALQLLWTCRASHLQLQQVPTLETGLLCPVCGSAPVASVIRLGGQAQGYRYLHCGLCASEWHMVRVKCSCCEQNGKIAYQELLPQEGQGQEASAAIKQPARFARAETCDDCHGYRKIFNQEHDYETEPLADDLASLTLDMLVAEAGYARTSANPLLWLGAEP
jgi:FdhE protein